MKSDEPGAPTVERPVLDYPFATVPEPGRALQVAPGVWWLRMPMPLALNHINLWALEDGDGWTVVDTGLRTVETADAWCRILTDAFQSRPVTRVLVTHMHPDHIGMAGWLTRRFGCRLWMTRLEYLMSRVLAADTGHAAPDDGVTFYRRAGWSDEALERYRARFGDFGKRIHAMPASYRRLRDGDDVTIGANVWRVVVGNGHSPEHACLYCAALKLFISGDQVLPRISSNVSVHPTEPDAEPISDWLASLAKLKSAVPDDVLVLPSHNEPFRRLHARLDGLAHEQARALDRLRAALLEPRRVIDLFATLFARKVEIDSMLLSFATGETVACLNHLLARGEAVARRDTDGVDWYQLG